MIARIWHGWSARSSADECQELLAAQLRARRERIEGLGEAYVWRRDSEDGTEFVTLTMWDSVDAIREHAGEDTELAVIPDELRQHLTGFDDRSTHYDVVFRA